MSSRSKNRKQRRASKRGLNRTPIEGHKHIGSNLSPPFAHMLGGKMAFSSWMNDRLPEMLWAALIAGSNERTHALGYFRRILNFIAKHPLKEDLSDITLTGISNLNQDLRQEVIAFIVEPPKVAEALAAMLLFESLPAKEAWRSVLPTAEPNVELLMSAVGCTLWHQSQEATDCRWLRLMAKVITHKIDIPGEMVDEWIHYPNKGEQTSVRPSIRSCEISLSSFDPPDLTWPNNFWKEAWENTPCMSLTKPQISGAPEFTCTRKKVSDVLKELEKHWEETHSTTAIDPKHDAVFGMAFYTLRIVEEMFSIGIGVSVIGRLGLRTILETRINLRYLLATNDPALWKRWREYGAGQAKLNALKFDGALDAPKHIDIESIEQIAGEDIWEEFLNINLAGWSGSDLRKLSEKADLKETYDKHYSWTSGYAHGMWGPIRESCFATCGNPLHRLHRYPDRRVLPDAVSDSTLLVDEILKDLDAAFPEFGMRLNT